MAAWGNALGGYRLQKRDRKGRFTSSGRAAKKVYKAQKRRNAASHRSRVRGSGKARIKELRRSGPRRAKNIFGGAATAGVGYSIGSERVYSRGMGQLKHGVSASYGRTVATRKMSKGLKRSRNRAARDQYRKSIGSTKKTRAIRNGIVVAGVAGMTYAAYKNGNVRVEGHKETGEILFRRKGNSHLPSFVISGTRGKNVTLSAYTVHPQLGVPKKFAGAGINKRYLYGNLNGKRKQIRHGLVKM